MINEIGVEEIDSDGTDEIVCPYCGYEFSDSWEEQPNDEDLGLIECPECEKQFYARRNISINYSTYQADYGKCPKCGKENVVLEDLHSSIGKFPPMCLDCGKIEHKRLMEEYMKRF